MEKLNWRKSTRSSNGGDTCVELARTPRSIALRDSKNPDGPYIEVSRRSLGRLLADVKLGEHNL
ncbi:MAG TPA: DUF397 domain-containing protein [Streptosporangiaceae bacterium]|jgi:hypothetical protein|nr:DUF397 domain-containing protein [Streptosporangiaceae bacterium]